MALLKALGKVVLIMLVLVSAITQAGIVHAGTNVWTSNGPAGGVISALAINPTTPSTLYAGTEGNGVFRSTDAGVTWSAVNTGLTNTCVCALVIHPTMPANLYAGTSGDGVFKTTDSGAHWTAFSVGLPNLEVRALAVDPATPALYAGTCGGVFSMRQRNRIYPPLVLRKP